MRRVALLVLVLASACGVPEQLMRISVRVTPTLLWEHDVSVMLESDEGSTEEGCSRFFPFSRLDVPAQGSATFDVLQAETRGPSGEPRCFRVNWNNRSMLAFGPVLHDVKLPAFAVWPGGRDPNADAATLPTLRQITFPTTPETYLSPAEDEYDVFKPRHFVEFIDDRGDLAWRLFEADATGAMLARGGRATANFDGTLLEGRPGTLRAGSFTAGRTYVTDSLGRPLEMAFEHRIFENELRVGESGEEFRPASRGVKCVGYTSTCPFTDGSFAVVEVNRNNLLFELEATHVERVLVRGLWATADTATLNFDYTDSEGVERHIRVPLTAQERGVHRNGGYGPARVDLTVFTSQWMERPRLWLADVEGDAVRIDRLAEVSFFQTRF
ncbi:MAG: hypothetical protein JNK82_43030 [Myxococcaceae bacterium]|nr:hypothetical protein [Myxococcaceae bacterium]